MNLSLNRDVGKYPHYTSEIFVIHFAASNGMKPVKAVETMMNTNEQKQASANFLSHRTIWRMFVSLALLLAGVSIALAGPREQAKAIHDRLTGVPATEADLDAMELLAPEAAANYAMTDGENSRYFATVTLKNFAAPWTNRDQSVFVPLNDYTTLVIGMVINSDAFNEILTADRLYHAPGISPAPSAASNAHYEALETRMMAPDFDPMTELVEVAQSTAYPVLPPNATAGAMTTRAASEAFFVAGTNRAMFRFTLLNHMCMDLEQVQDTSIVPDRIRQDVSRSPGADSRVFLNNCIGCHAGMDPMAQAFAYYNFDEDTSTMEYTNGVVQPKYFNNNETFADGFVTPDDSWSNYWREGQNSILEWDTQGLSLPGSGNGARTLGEELAGTRAFAQCQVKKVFNTVCLRDPVDGTDRTQVRDMTDTFIGSNYNLKQVFAQSAAYCTQGL
jgi:hypothetical protein